MTLVGFKDWDFHFLQMETQDLNSPLWSYFREISVGECDPGAIQTSAPVSDTHWNWTPKFPGKSEDKNWGVGGQREFDENFKCKNSAGPMKPWENRFDFDVIKMAC